MDLSLARRCGLEGPEGAEGEAGARFLSPLEGAEFLLFPDVPLEDQGIPVRVLASGRETLPYWPLRFWTASARRTIRL